MRVATVVTMKMDGMNNAGFEARLIQMGCRVLSNHGPFGRTNIVVKDSSASVRLTMDPSRVFRNKLFDVTEAQMRLLDKVHASGAIAT